MVSARRREQSARLNFISRQTTYRAIPQAHPRRSLAFAPAATTLIDTFECLCVFSVSLCVLCEKMIASQTVAVLEGHSNSTATPGCVKCSFMRVGRTIPAAAL
jgi:hypothetical protein